MRAQRLGDILRLSSSLETIEIRATPAAQMAFPLGRTSPMSPTLLYLHAAPRLPRSPQPAPNLTPAAVPSTGSCATRVYPTFQVPRPMMGKSWPLLSLTVGASLTMVSGRRDGGVRLGVRTRLKWVEWEWRVEPKPSSLSIPRLPFPLHLHHQCSPLCSHIISQMIIRLSTVSR